VPGLVLLARRMVPPEVVADCAARAARDAGPRVGGERENV